MNKACVILLARIKFASIPFYYVITYELYTKNFSGYLYLVILGIPNSIDTIPKVSTPLIFLRIYVVTKELNQQ